VRTPVAHLDALPRLPAGTAVIDSHCHLEGEAFAADRDAMLARAAAAGVAAMITVGASGPMECNRQAVALAAAHATVFATVGTHPHDARTVSDDGLAEIARLAGAPKVVAIGETGLDYHYDHSPRPQQQAAFRRFVQLARQLGRPLVVHLRAADDDALAILHEEHAAEVGGVIHCFASDAAAARRFLDLGFHLSFSGIVTFKGADAVRAAARVTPADRLLVETDAPFLAPVPHRGRRNEPALVVQTAAVLAEVRGERLASLAGRTTENACRLFGILPVATCHHQIREP
jgi:TatD DNase family protein